MMGLWRCQAVNWVLGGVYIALQVWSCFGLHQDVGEDGSLRLLLGCQSLGGGDQRVAVRCIADPGCTMVADAGPSWV